MSDHDLEATALRYLDALDAGDLETVAALWEQAADDADLERLLGEVNEGLFDEAGLGADWASDAAHVRELLHQHLPSGFAAAPPGPLTASDVAARLQADAALSGRLTEGDRAANAGLLGNQSPLPEQLGQPQLERWTAQLGVKASPQYWRAFRQAAVLLAMGRCQRAGQLAAARQAAPPPRGGQP